MPKLITVLALNLVVALDWIADRMRAAYLDPWAEICRLGRRIFDRIVLIPGATCWPRGATVASDQVDGRLLQAEAYLRRRLERLARPEVSLGLGRRVVA